MRDAYKSLFFVITVNDDRRIVIRSRTERGFASLEEAEAEYRVMLPACEKASNPRFGLLVDMRPAPPRNDPAFEQLISRYYPRLYRGFREVAVLVKTQAGKLQITRICEATGIRASVFLDESAAIAHLGIEQPTGPRLRAGVVPPAASSEPARRLNRRGA